MKVLKRIRKQVALLCAAALTVTSLQATTFVSYAEQNDAVSIAVLSTTDMHGKCWDTDLMYDTQVNNSLLKVSTVVKEFRQKYDDNVLLIDNGDNFQGTQVSTYGLAQADGFNGITPMAVAMKYIGYDAFILGNHEFNYPWKTMKKVYDYLEVASGSAINVVSGAGASVPVLAANLVWKETKDGNIADDNVFKTYITKDYVVDGKTFTVGVLGLENTDCTRWDVPDNYPNINFAHLDNKNYDMSIEAQKYVNEMKKDGCDFVIVSYHAGLGTDTGELKFGENTENQVLRVIKNTTGIDMIIAGHDHTSGYTNSKYSDKDGKDVLVVNGGGKELTQTDLQVTAKNDGTFDVNVKVPEKNISLYNYKNDEALKSILKPYTADASAYMNYECGTIADAGWDAKTDYYMEQTDTMDLINRAQIDRGSYYLGQKYDKDAFKKLQKKYGSSYTNEVDLSCTSVNTTNNYYIKSGKLLMKNIYSFYKYDNSLYVLPLTGQQIKDALEFVASERLDVSFSKGEAVFKKIGDNFTNPIFYGIDFTYDLAKPAGERVNITKFKNGKEFQLDQTYNLAINNYHLGNGPFAGYSPDNAIWSQTDDLGGTIQELIKEYVGNASSEGVAPDRSNWKIIYSGEIPEEKPVIKRPAEVSDPISNDIFTGEYKNAVNVKDAPERKAGTGTVIGQVVFSYAGKYHIIEDVIDNEICGYLVYDGNEKHVYKNGDIIAATGTFTDFSSLPEMSNVTDLKVIKSLGEDFVIAPQVVTVDQLGEDYINETVVIQDVVADRAKITDATGTVTIHEGANLPDGIVQGTTKIDAVAVCSTYYSTIQLRNNSSSDYTEHKGIYDPVPNTMFQTESNLSDAYAKNKSDEVTVLGQVAYKFSSSNYASGNKNNIILQDVINGDVLGMLVYDSKNYASYGIGDVVKVTGAISEYGGLKQISAAKMERVKVDISFQPQEVTVSQLGADYKSEFVQIKEASLGNYNGEGATDLSDTTGKTTIFKGAEPGEIVTGITVEGICSLYNEKPQLRVGASTDYIAPYHEDIPVADERLLRVPVIETSDVHGFLVDVSTGNQDTYQYRMAYVSDTVNDIRNDEEKGDVLLLDGGDIYQGNPVSNLLEGQSMIAAYDAMNYDAVTLGNHEFDWGVTQLIDSDGTMGSYNLDNAKGKVAGDSDIPVVCGNLYYKENGERVNFTKDYTIVEKKAKSLDGKTEDVKIAVFGYVDDYSKDIMAAKIAPYTIDESKLEDIQKEAEKLEKDGTADISVLLVHASAAGTAGKLSKDTAFDLVLGGHTHSNEVGTKNGVAYVQPKNQAQAYAYAEICVDPETKEVTVENAKTENVVADKTALYDKTENADKLDAEIVKISDIAVEEVAPTMNVQIGTVKEQINKKAINGNSFSSTAGTWVTEIMNQATGSDVSFTNNGGIRTEITFDTPTRMITTGDVYTIAPFCNLLPTFEVTYEKLKEIAEYAIGKGSSLGLRMGGATAYYTDNKVTTLFVGKTLVYDAGEYKVDKDTKLVICTNEYIATSDTPFKSLTSREAAAGTSPAIDNEAFIAALKKEAKVNNGNLHVNTSATMVKGTWDGVTIPEDYSHISDEKNNGGGSSVTPSEPEATVKPETPVIPDKVQNVETEISSKAVTAEGSNDGFFYTADGKKVTDAIVKTKDGDRYILNKDGAKYISSMVTVKNGNTYITDSLGSVVTGKIIKTNGSRYYATKDTGKVAMNKIIKVSGYKYYATASGAFATGKIVTVSGKKYYTTKIAGKIITNQIFRLKGKKYFANKAGELAISKWISYDGKKYYCNKNGIIMKSK